MTTPLPNGSMPCHVCGSSVDGKLRHCSQCGQLLITLERSSPGDGHGVILEVIPDDRQIRKAFLELLTRLGFVFRASAVRDPVIPSLLVDGLTRESAEELAGSLVAHKVGASIRGPDGRIRAAKSEPSLALLFDDRHRWIVFTVLLVFSVSTLGLAWLARGHMGLALLLLATSLYSDWQVVRWFRRRRHLSEPLVQLPS